MVVPPLTKKELFKRGATETGSILPPLGLAYIAAVLEKDNHHVEMIDGIADQISMDEIAQRSKEFDIVGLTAITTFELRLEQTVNIIKNVNPSIKIVVGGPHATALPFDLIKKNVDFVVVGEGEYTFLELVKQIKNKQNYDVVKGLIYNKKGKSHFTGNRGLIENLDTLPFPARHLLPMQKYKSSEARSNKQPSYSIITSRGCPFNCVFCNKNIFGRKFRSHSPEYVVKEMELLKNKYGARDIAIWDDNFTVDKKRVHEICNLIIKKRLNISWSCEARVDCVDFILLKKMRKAGCDYIAYGVESGSEIILKSIRKGFTKKQVIETFKSMKKAKVGIRAYFMLGHIGETRKEMEETINFAKSLEPEIASFTLWVPLPGTDAYEEACKYGKFKEQKFWEKHIISEFNFLEEPVYVPEGITSKGLMELHKKAYRKFYFRPSYILGQILKISSLEDIKRLTKGFFTVFKS